MLRELFGLEGKTALVTGASSGLGRQMSKALAKVIDDNTGKVTDIRQQIPLRFIAEPKDLDGLVLYLASNNASRYVTGSEFVIDGGISANCKGI